MTAVVPKGTVARKAEQGEATELELKLHGLLKRAEATGVVLAVMSLNCKTGCVILSAVRCKHFAEYRDRRDCAIRLTTEAMMRAGFNHTRCGVARVLGSGRV